MTKEKKSRFLDTVFLLLSSELSCLYWDFYPSTEDLLVEFQVTQKIVFINLIYYVWFHKHECKLTNVICLEKGQITEVSLAIVNTLLNGSFGGLTAMLSHRIYNNYKGKTISWSLLTTINGSLTGRLEIELKTNLAQGW